MPAFSKAGPGNGRNAGIAPQQAVRCRALGEAQLRQFLFPAQGLCRLRLIHGANTSHLCQHSCTGEHHIPLLSSDEFLEVSSTFNPFFKKILQNKLHFACWPHRLAVCHAHPAPARCFCKTSPPSLHPDLPKPLVKHTQLKPGISAAELIELLAPGNVLNLGILHLSLRNTELQPREPSEAGCALGRRWGRKELRGHICRLSWIQSLPVSCISYLPFPGCK